MVTRHQELSEAESMRLCPKCKEPMVLAIIKFGDTGELEERTLECKPCDIVLRSIAKIEVALRK